MWEKIDSLMPLFIVVVPLIGSYVGARIGRKQLLDKVSIALNEQGDEAIVQYRIIKTLLSILEKMVGALHDAKVLNGNSIPIQEELTNIQNMMDTDILEKKKKRFYVRCRQNG